MYSLFIFPKEGRFDNAFQLRVDELSEPLWKGLWEGTWKFARPVCMWVMSIRGDHCTAFVKTLQVMIHGGC